MYNVLTASGIGVVIASVIAIKASVPSASEFHPPWKTGYIWKDIIVEYRPNEVSKSNAFHQMNENQFRSLSYYSGKPPHYRKNPKHFFGNALSKLFSRKPRPRSQFKYKYRQEEGPDFGEIDNVTPREPSNRRPTTRPLTSVQATGHQRPHAEECDVSNCENMLDSWESQNDSYEMKHRPAKSLSPHQKLIQIFMPILVGLMAWLGTLMMMTSPSSSHKNHGSGEMSLLGGSGNGNQDGQNIHIHMDGEEEEIVVTKDEEAAEKEKQHEKLLKSLDVTDQVLSIVERGLLLAVRKVELLNVISGLTFPGGGSGGGGQGGGVRLQQEIQKLTNLTSDAQNLLQGTLGLVSNNAESAGLSSNVTGISIEQILENGLGSTNETGDALSLELSTPDNASTTILPITETSATLASSTASGTGSSLEVVEQLKTDVYLDSNLNPSTTENEGLLKNFTRENTRNTNNSKVVDLPETPTKSRIFFKNRSKISGQKFGGTGRKPTMRNTFLQKIVDLVQFKYQKIGHRRPMPPYWAYGVP